jgi:FkbM family methyltransferase
MTMATGVVHRLNERIGAAGREAKYLMSLASDWRERAGMIRYLALLYVARLMPLDTYHWTTTVRLRGSRYAVGVRTAEIYIVDEVYGGRLYDKVDAYIPEAGWTVVDVGANVGVFSLHAAHLGATVYAFEPNPACFARLQANIEMNGTTESVTPLNAAVSDAPGRGAMQVERGGTTGGTVARGGDEAIQITTLDAALADASVDRIDLLKVDIEGAEVRAFRGGAETLKRTDRIIAEYHSPELLVSCNEILEQNGFVTDLKFVYYPEEYAGEGNEVGMLYARRVAN